MEPNTEESRRAFILNFWFGDLKEGDVPPEELSRMWWAKDEKTAGLISNPTLRMQNKAGSTNGKRLRAARSLS